MGVRQFSHTIIFRSEMKWARTHLRLTAIWVEDPHGIVCTIDPRQDEDDTIGANAEVPVAQLHRLLRRHLRHWRIPIVHLQIHTGIIMRTEKGSDASALKTARIARIHNSRPDHDEVVPEALVLDEVEGALGLPALEERGLSGGPVRGDGHGDDGSTRGGAAANREMEDPEYGRCRCGDGGGREGGGGGGRHGHGTECETVRGSGGGRRTSRRSLSGGNDEAIFSLCRWAHPTEWDQLLFRLAQLTLTFIRIVSVSSEKWRMGNQI
jgi:hypothetical protein